MSDTTTGIIYKIICKLDHKFVYIGSTYDSLRNRWQRHKSHYREWIKDPDSSRTCPCFRYFEKYGIENFKMIEIKSYDIHLKDRRCLDAYETLWICKTKGCCNINPPIQHLKKKIKKVQNNRGKRAEQNRQYYEENREYITEHNKQYYELNKEKIRKYRKVKIACQCGAEVTTAAMSAHRKSKKHKAFLANL